MGQSNREGFIIGQLKIVDVVLHKMENQELSSEADSRLVKDNKRQPEMLSVICQWCNA